MDLSDTLGRAVLLSSAVYGPFRISKDEQINVYFPFSLLWGCYRVMGWSWLILCRARHLGPA